jgi:hypothetical protein
LRREGCEENDGLAGLVIEVCLRDELDSARPGREDAVDDALEVAHRDVLLVNEASLDVKLVNGFLHPGEWIDWDLLAQTTVEELAFLVVR